MTIQTCDIAGCVARYAARLHSVIGDRHHVASPLGAWLLLALAGPASSGADRESLTDIIGCDVDSAATAATALLAHPHPLVASAAAVWTRSGSDISDHFRRWRDGLPAEVTFGALPDQAGLDAWAREHTFGLIEQFPIKLNPEMYLVFASALATKVSWKSPFDLVPAGELGSDSPWVRQLSQVLRTPDRHHGGHRQFIAMTDQVDDVAVHVATAQDGLLVYSVAAGRSKPASQVLAAAHRIACADAVHAPVRYRDLADLPLGEGPAWLVREERSSAADDVRSAVLPAWSARSEHDLKDPSLGFAEVRSALTESADPFAAKQAAMARYSRTGFEAAAVTAIAIEMSMVQAQGIRRVADLRFGHPYAVVAVTVQPAAGGELAWDGVPVFSAWVAQPEDASENDEQAATSGRPL